MKIAFFSEVYEPQVNGVVITLTKLTEYLRRRGHQILLVIPRLAETTSGTQTVTLRSLRFPLYPEMRVILPHWRFHRKAFEQIANFNPDLVHVWTPGVLAFFGLKWARQTGRPVVSSYETDILRYLAFYGFDRFSPQALRYFRWLHNNSQKTYVPSLQTKHFLERNGIDNVHVFDRGVDTVRFHPVKRNEAVRNKFMVKSNSILILYVGRISREKNLKMLLDLFDRVSHQHPSARLVLTGEGPLLSKLSKRYGSSAIIFTGAKHGEDLAVLFASADIFVMPSTTETLSLVTLEAMASQLAVVAMRAGGVAGLIEHSKTGLLADSETEFETLLLRLVQDVSERTRLAVQARQHAEKRTWEGAFGDLERQYEELILVNARH